ncbi:MAG: oligosaccharide flippase family protein, partial [Lachnospiraceae bacterium]|nr:oligosaccharide flippase family protein [Lachnospiraceae bacterium]
MSLKHFFHTHTLIAGTLFLTAAGLFSRVLGFFYRIYLSRIVGAEGLGIYQMVFPVYSICFSLCAGSIQTAVSRFTAADPARAKRTLFTGLAISLSIASLLSLMLWINSEFIAVHILTEPRCAPLLPPLALAIPCTAVHACICGYCYGKENVKIPAIAQLLEQCIRIFSV